MSHDSLRDQFFCRIWISRLPVWTLLIVSTYGMFITALERYVAVIYPIWYKIHVSAPPASYVIRRPWSHVKQNI